MDEVRSPRWLELGAAALTWTVWCLLSSAPVAFLVRFAAIAAGNAALVTNVPIAVALEMLLLGVTAFVAFRLLARLEPPAWYWAVAPAGYVASFAAYLVIARVVGDTSVVMTAADALEIAGVVAITAAAAYVGGMRRDVEDAPPAETGDRETDARDDVDPDAGSGD